MVIFHSYVSLPEGNLFTAFVALRCFSFTVQGGAPKIAKLVPITPITMVYGTQRTIVTGAYKPTYNWGASHCR